MHMFNRHINKLIVIFFDNLFCSVLTLSSLNGVGNEDAGQNIAPKV
jgi:hypothetical protein